MYGVAQSQFVFEQNFAPVGIQSDVLRGGKQRKHGGQPEYGDNRGAWRQPAQQANRDEQSDLHQQYPASSSSEYRQGVAIEKRSPEELPGVGKLDQGEKTDSLEIDAFAAQPGRQQVKQKIQGQAGTKAGEHADQHLAREQDAQGFR